MPPPPQVMERSGWIPGLVLLLLMSLANAFSVEVVFRLCRLTGRPTSLGEIGDKAPPLHTPAPRFTALVWKWKGLPCQRCLRRRPAPPS